MVFKNCHNLKGSNVSVREHSSPKNAEISRHAYILEKEKKIKTRWTKGGEVWLQPNDGRKAVIVKDLKDLEKYQ